MNDFFKGFKKGMTGFGHNISVIVNSALLIIVYFVGVGITSIIAKLFNKKFLDMKIADKETYWKDLNLKNKDIEEYHRQF